MILLISYFTFALQVCAVRYTEIKPIRFPGSIICLHQGGPPQQQIQSTAKTFGIYFSRKRIEIIESSNNAFDSDLKSQKKDVILCDVIGLPVIDPSARSIIEAELRGSTRRNPDASMAPGFVSKFSSSDVDSSVASFLFNRDGGLYDNLPYQWGKSKSSKKELYEYISKYDTTRRLRSGGIKSGATSPIAAVRYAIEDTLGCQLMGLLIEKSDEIDDDRIVLGGSLLLSKSNDASAYAPAMSILTKVTSSDENGEGDCELINCYLDELILLSLASDTPTFIAEDLLDELSDDARLISCLDDDEVIVEGPLNEARGASPESKKSLNQQLQRTSNQAPAAWEVYDPQLFFKWSPVDKRAVLRSSGVKKLPRPREGELALDELLLDLMDDAVRNEIRRLKLVRRTTTSAFNTRVDSSEDVDSFTRQELLQKIGESIDAGQIDKAVELKSRFMMLTSLKADPTQETGSYDRYLDQDDWYMAARRKSMGPKK